MKMLEFVIGVGKKNTRFQFSIGLAECVITIDDSGDIIVFIKTDLIML